MINDEQLSKFFRNIAEQVVGKENVHVIKPPMGADDFAYYVEHVASCYFSLGSSNFSKKINSGLHTPTFDVDERVMKIGVELLATSIETYLNTEH